MKTKTLTPHPAKYSDALLPVFASMLNGTEKLLDPFGGTGKIFSLLQWHPNLIIDAVEIEPEWASLDSRITQGNALCLDWDDNYFDAICVSPAYGNRMADHDKQTIRLGWEYRKTYASALGRDLHANNTGSLQWGEKYKELHFSAWKESKRVLKNRGTFILNIKNHIRAGKEQLVTEWHIETLIGLGFSLLEHRQVNTPSMRKGKNSNARVPYESVIKFILKKE